jgi:SAM-dependent methyltransferase
VSRTAVPRPDAGYRGGVPADARYDAIADFYVERAGNDLDDAVGASVLALLGDVRGQSILDLACGHGRATLELARRGARVTALDLSEALLGRGRGRAAAEQLEVRWLHGDATAADVLAGEAFDTVVSHFALTDIDDLDAALATVNRLLRPGGRFVFSILHPCFAGRGDDAPSSWRPGSSYFDEGWWLSTSPGFRGRVGSNHRMLSTYLNALVDHGLRIEHLAEPRRVGDWPSEPELIDLGPAFLVVRCRKE